MGRRPPVFFVRANNVPPNSIDLISCGQIPLSSKLINAVTAETSACPTSKDLISSSRCCGRIPSGPAEEPAGKVRMMSVNFDSVICIGCNGYLVLVVMATSGDT